MKKIYFKESNGNKVTVAVTEEVAQELRELRREEWRGESYERYHTTSLDVIIDAGHDFADERSNAETILIAREEKKRKNKTMRKLKEAYFLLTPLQRETLRKIYVLNKTQAEIARDEGVVESVISRRIRRIYARLKKKI